MSGRHSRSVGVPVHSGAMSRFGHNKSALVVVDVQNDVVGVSENRDEMVANINALLEKARAEQVPVVWVQHSHEQGLPRDTEGWRFVPELSPRADEPLVHKLYGDSFADTDLAEQLERLGVDHLVVTGAQTDMCIRSTLHGALARGYDATLVGDAHGTEDMREWGSPVDQAGAIAYANLYWSESKTHEAEGGVVATGEVEFKR